MEPGTRLGPYEIQEQLGAGGMGEVYRASDPRLRRDVAIKRLPADMAADGSRRRALLLEARGAARIKHQGVATLYDVLEIEDELYLVMELVEGRTLRQFFEKGISIPRAVDITIQCAEGIAAAHGHGIVHRDIKPDNVMIGDDGTVKVLDFGVATLPEGLSAETATATDLLSDASSPAGTVPFMAPEVLLGNESDGRADVFSLGVTLYAMLSGLHPFSAKTGPATVDRILHHEPAVLAESNPHVPAELDAVVRRMLAKDPKDRYGDMDVVVAELKRVRANMSAPSQSAPLAPSPSDRASTGLSRVPAAVLGVALVMAAFGAWWFTAPEGPATTAVAERFDATQWIIAVLPAAVGEDDPELEALSQGLAATLTGMLTQMSRAHDLQVVPTSAVLDLELDSFLDARRELGVTLAVDFQLRRVGDQLRVNVNLIDTAAQRQLDAATVDGLVDDAIDLEEQVALRALRMLRLELMPMERDLLRVGTEEPRAHDYYLRATGYLQEYSEPDSVQSATTLLEQALQVDPDYARAHAALGEAHWNQYRLTDDAVWVDRARSECEVAIEKAPNDSAGYRCLGTVLNGTGNLAEAVEALEQAKRLDPTDDTVYLALGSAYQNQGETSLAEATYQEAVTLRPHYWGGYSWLGTFYLRSGRVDDAVTNLQQVVALAPDSYGGFSNLGVAYYVAQDWTQARRAFERALELNPQYSSAISNLGTLYFYEGNYAASAQMFEQALEAAESNYLAWGNLGDAYYWAAGERDKSRDAYGRAIELGLERLDVNPNDALLAVHLARYYAATGAETEAEEMLATALAGASEDSYVMQGAAQAQELLGLRSAAIESLRAAINLGYPVAEVAVDPVFGDLRDDPGYADITGEEV
ncbi:MAG: protein kinase [Acidobacteria bacterium]|nr:protein kinase [Acidobacteriota bacterium]